MSYNPKVESVLKAISNGEKLSHVDLSNSNLTSIPEEIFLLRDSLELLNLGGNELSSLPDSMISLQKLRILFFAQNKFKNIPVVLGQLVSLFMLSFKSNQIDFIDALSLSPSICWLILTDNKISELPSSIGKLTGLRKLMLAGNDLSSLPDEMQHCQELELVRLAANKLKLLSLPSWFWNLPKLSWLALAGNDVTAETAKKGENERSESAVEVNLISWTDLEIMEKLGEGASGIIYKAKWNRSEEFVAVKLFKGGRTSDGLPEDEMKAFEAGGKHLSSIQVLGRITNAPDSQLGLIMPFISEEFTNLGGPPSFDTMTRDTFPIGLTFNLSVIFEILSGVSSICLHLHKRGISHGDLYAHNILVNSEGRSLLSDFGASSFYKRVTLDGEDNIESDKARLLSGAMEGFEVRAFGCLIEDLVDRLKGIEVYQKTIQEGFVSSELNFDRNFLSAVEALRTLQIECFRTDHRKRPSFQEIHDRVNMLPYCNLT